MSLRKDKTGGNSAWVLTSNVSSRLSLLVVLSLVDSPFVLPLIKNSLPGYNLCFKRKASYPR